MSDLVSPSESPRSAALRDALRGLAPGQRLEVETTTEGKLRGHFHALEEGTLVMKASPLAEAVVRIPFATVLAVTTVHGCGREGAMIAMVLGVLPLLWLAGLLSEWQKELGSFLLALILLALVALGFVVLIGFTVGLAFDRREPLVVTKSPAS